MPEPPKPPPLGRGRRRAVANGEVPAPPEARGGMLSSTMPAEFRGTWAFVLEPTDDGRTRLIERLRFRFDGPQPAGAELAMEAMGFGLFLMMRRQMLGIRDRAERIAAVEDAGAGRTRGGPAGVAPRWAGVPRPGTATGRTRSSVA